MNAPLPASPRALLAILCLGLLAPFVRAEPQSDVLPLGETGRGWRFSKGDEFPGAKGSLENMPAQAGQNPWHVLTFDFTEGGRYVAAFIDVKLPGTFSELRVRVKSSEPRNISLRLRDDSGQIHQVPLAYTDAGRWQVLRLELKGLHARLHWGGKNDGTIHYPIGQIWICAGHPVQEKSGSIEFADLKALR